MTKEREREAVKQVRVLLCLLMELRPLALPGGCGEKGSPTPPREQSQQAHRWEQMKAGRAAAGVTRRLVRKSATSEDAKLGEPH